MLARNLVQILVAATFLVSGILASTEISAQGEETFDPLVVSKLRYKLRNLDKNEQCNQFCKGICAMAAGKDPLGELATTEIDFKALSQAVDSLKVRRNTLAAYLSECIDDIRGGGSVTAPTPTATLEKDSLAAHLKVVSEENERFRKDKEQFQAENERLRAEAERLRGENEQLKAESEKSKGLGAELEIKKKEIAHVATANALQVAGLMAQVETLKRNIDSDYKTIAALSGQIDALKKQNAAGSGASEREKAQFVGQLAKCTGDLETEKKRSAAELAKAKKSLEEEKEKQESSCAETKAELEKWQDWFTEMKRLYGPNFGQGYGYGWSG